MWRQKNSDNNTSPHEYPSDSGPLILSPYTESNPSHEKESNDRHHVKWDEEAPDERDEEAEPGAECKRDLIESELMNSARVPIIAHYPSFDL